MKRIAFAAVVLALLSAWMALPAVAQTTSAPALSFERVSVGFRAEYVYYRPEHSLDLDNSGEFKVGIPIAYNLGRYSSLGATARYGITSKVKELSVGITLHLLARGRKP
jgi:hypothetical protein